ncbi:MAG: glycoside hydrolase family 26 protein [Streptosporangiaceae bacterium]
MKSAAKALVAVTAAAFIVGCSSSAAPKASKSATAPVQTVKSVVGLCGSIKPLDLHHYFGVIDGNPGSLRYNEFLQRSGVHPTLVDYFFNFGAKWTPTALCYAANHQAVPLVQFNLRRLSAAAIAAGRADAYVTRLADGMKSYALPVVVSIGHEMNGNWYPWGWQHTPATTFVQAWRRVHDIFAKQKVKNVIWMWTVNRAVAPATGPAPWWPGQAYVNWVGIDGHDRHATDSFKKVFGSTIADVRKLTSDPILISETAVAAGPHRSAQMANLFRTVYQTPGLIGIIYLNVRTVRIDWQLKSASSVKAFAKAVAPFEPSAG